MTVHDVHCHFFSARFFETLGREKHGQESLATADQVAGELGWDAPGSPEALADRWIDELDRYRVSRAALIASVPGDEDSVAAAVARHPGRFVGFFMLDASARDAPERATRAFGELGLRCACLFPAMHRYRLDDDRVAKVFEIAAARRAAIFVHCGYLSVERPRAAGNPQPVRPALRRPARGRGGRGELPDGAGHRAALRRRLLPRGADGRRGVPAASISTRRARTGG